MFSLLPNLMFVRVSRRPDGRSSNSRNSFDKSSNTHVPGASSLAPKSFLHQIQALNYSLVLSLCHFSFLMPKFGSCLINVNNFNPLNAELNPICYLLALLGAHHFLHISRIRVKSLTLRILISYIYIYIYIYITLLA